MLRKLCLACLLVGLPLISQALPISQAQSGNLAVNGAPPLQLLYDNGLPLAFETWDFTDGNSVSNSFSCGSTICVAESFNIYVHPPNPILPPQPVINWEVTSTAFGGDILGAGTTGLSCSLFNADADIFRCGSTGPIHIPIPRGAASFVLSGAVPALEWNQSQTPTNLAFFTNADGITQQIPGEAFQLYGTTVPEPTNILMLGSGILGVAGVLRRNLIP